MKYSPMDSSLGTNHIQTPISEYKPNTKRDSIKQGG